MTHRVSEVKQGARYSVTFYTPGNLDMVPEGDFEELDFLSVCKVTVFWYGTPVRSKASGSPCGHHRYNFHVRAEAHLIWTCGFEPRGTGEEQQGFRESTFSSGSTWKAADRKMLFVCQHIRVKIDQEQQKALPVCRSCSFMDESSRHQT
eukprot:2944632-Amphidinium_carterae.1